MDRIPTTSEGILGGIRGTAPTSGSPQGRLGERQVSQAPQTPRPQAAALKWADVENRGENQMGLTVRSATGHEGSAGVRVISGEAVGYLEEIRGDAPPENSVFGIGRNSIYRRVKNAMRAEGLAARGVC